MSDNFQKWFGESKVVDDMGAPLVVFHGTRRQFDSFVAMKPSGAFGNPVGIYFTDDLNEAAQFAEDVDGATDEKSRIVAVNICIRNASDGLIRKRSDGTTEYIVFRPEAIKIVIDNLYKETSQPTLNPNFRNWFQNSKVVDANGMPLVVYHGTTAEFDSFDRPSFFTPNPDSAATYAKGKGGQIMPVYLSLKNPVLIDFLPPNKASVIQRQLQKYINKGHDGAIVEYGADGKRGYIAFHPHLIKSAIGNDGHYDRKSNSLTDQPVPIEEELEVARERMQP